MSSYEFVGSDPIEHFWAGTVQPGDVVEFDAEPEGPWKPSKKKPTVEAKGDAREQLPAPPSEPDTEPARGESDTSEEG